MSNETPPNHFGASSARNLASPEITRPQLGSASPRWLMKLLPWMPVPGGVFRLNQVAADGIATSHPP